MPRWESSQGKSFKKVRTADFDSVILCFSSSRTDSFIILFLANNLTDLLIGHFALQRSARTHKTPALHDDHGTSGGLGPGRLLCVAALGTRARLGEGSDFDLTYRIRTESRLIGRALGLVTGKYPVFSSL